MQQVHRLDAKKEVEVKLVFKVDGIKWRCALLGSYVELVILTACSSVAIESATACPYSTLALH